MRRLMEAGSRKRTFYVEQYGGIWKVNRAELRRILEGIIKGAGYNLEGTGIGDIDLQPLDMTPEEAANKMDELLGIQVEVPDEEA